jgi:hypothetical protein
MLAGISNDEEFVYTCPPTAPGAARGIAAFARFKETPAFGSLNMPNLYGLPRRLAEKIIASLANFP